MHIKVLSGDSELCRIFRETLTEFPLEDWRLSTLGPRDTPAGADLCVIDYHPGTQLPEDLDWSNSRYLLCIGRNDLDTLVRTEVQRRANVLLKPISRAALHSLLGFAIAAHRDRVAATSDLRADRDDILQWLIEANLRLQQYDQDRTNFLARAVHDFRAPLTALSGYCGLLLSEPFEALNPEQAEVLRRMQRSARRLARMTSAMFDLSMGNRAKKTPEFQTQNLSEIVEQAIHEVSPFTAEKRISISLDLTPASPELQFDPSQMEQVFVNLLDNACKFTPRDGEITIRGYASFRERRNDRHTTAFAEERRRRTVEEPNVYRIDIANSGTRIPQSQLERIFEEYVSYDGSRDRSGGGLGLAICRSIILQHGGEIWADNRDSGPAFSFILPLELPAHPIFQHDLMSGKYSKT